MRLYVFTHHHFVKEEERKGGKKGRLLGIITLSDVLRYIIGETAIGEGVEPAAEDDSGIPTPSSALTSATNEEITPRAEEPSQPPEDAAPPAEPAS